MIGYGVFRQTNMQRLTANLERVLFFTLQCKRMYFQSTKLTNIFYFGTSFIHSLAFDRNWTPSCPYLCLPVMLFKRYLGKRPSEMKESGPFYLTVIDKPVSSIWYKKTPMGKNTINTIMKNMKKNSPLKNLCPEKNLTNHSARKTVVKKLKSSGIPKCEIKNITGHASASGLDDYDSGDEREQQIISRAIDNSGPVPSRGALSQLYPANSTASSCAPGHVYNFTQCSVTLNIVGNDAVQKSTSDIRRGYKRIFIEESDSEWSECILNVLHVTLFKKALTLYFQSWKFVSRPGCQCPGIFVGK